MTAQEKLVIAKMVHDTQHPSAPGNAYDFVPGEGLKQIEVPKLVAGTPNHQLLDSELYKAGYRRAHQELAERLAWLLTMTPADMRKYTGRPKSKRPAKT